MVKLQLKLNICELETCFYFEGASDQINLISIFCSSGLFRERFVFNNEEISLSNYKT